MAAKLIFNYGTVSSGKTVHLLNMCFNYESAGWNVTFVLLLAACVLSIVFMLMTITKTKQN